MNELNEKPLISIKIQETMIKEETVFIIIYQLLFTCVFVYYLSDIIHFLTYKDFKDTMNSKKLFWYICMSF